MTTDLVLDASDRALRGAGWCKRVQAFEHAVSSRYEHEGHPRDHAVAQRLAVLDQMNPAPVSSSPRTC